MHQPELKDPPLTRRRILQIAWPIILANAAVPMLGLVDTAVIGHHGSASELGAIALGALIFSFAYWSFGFLRMGTSGFTAQALGARDEAGIRATLGRALLVAVAIGAVLIAVHRPLGNLAMTLLSGSAEVEQVARAYFDIRIWSAPAGLASFAVIGALIGLGRTRVLLTIQLFMNGLNIALDVLFAGVFGWGARGVALGTAIAEWLTLFLSIALVLRILKGRHTDDAPFWPTARILDVGRLKHVIQANADIMLRTLMMVFGFTWFTDQSAQFGDTVLAANHILLQFLAFAAFFLDGYAFAVESLIGNAIGARRTDVLDRAVRTSSEVAGITAAALAAVMFIFGPFAIDLLTDLEPVRAQARATMPFAALYTLVAFVAFQLDGIFIGATRTRDMRNMAIVSVLVFMAAWWPLTTRAGNRGLWIAFIIYVAARGATLASRYPALRRSVG